MAEITGASGGSKYYLPSTRNVIDWFLAAAHTGTLKKQYKCSHFRILVIGRANAGKTTILEKVCGVEKGTGPVIIHDKKGKLAESPIYFLMSVPSR